MVVSSNSQLRIIAGQWRGRKIDFLDQSDLRPTPDRVRETVFNWLQSEVPGSICLDLFAGSGALGLEAVSRGAKQVVMVDGSKQVCEMIQKNVDVLTSRSESQLQSIEVVTSDATAFVEKDMVKYDVVFLDPPYRSGLLSQICTLLEQGKCLTEHAKIYIEHDVKQSLPELPENWHVLKNKSAGQVSYYLIDRFES